LQEILQCLAHADYPANPPTTEVSLAVYSGYAGAGKAP
jgi:hypothetical protein